MAVDSNNESFRITRPHFTASYYANALTKIDTRRLRDAELRFHAAEEMRVSAFLDGACIGRTMSATSTEYRSLPYLDELARGA